MKKSKWGILAPGKMAAKFTSVLKLLDNAELYAVGSRDAERAEMFARDNGFKKSYGSYEELASNSEVGIIYIAPKHSFSQDLINTLDRIRKEAGIVFPGTSNNKYLCPKLSLI